MIILTRKQRKTLHRKWCESNQGLTYREFRRTVEPGWDCIMVPWCGMWVGIEGAGRHDGYAHT